MTQPEFVPDEVPLADAVEQSRPAAEPADTETLDPAERVPVDDGDPPLESSGADWQEQREVVDLDPEDDFR